MVVTCPGCQARYRVRNETVPTDGARMRCPRCETLFLAMPPAQGDVDPFAVLMQRVPPTPTQSALSATSTAPIPSPHKPVPTQTEMTPAAGSSVLPSLSAESIDDAPVLELNRTSSVGGRMAKGSIDVDPAPVAPRRTTTTANISNTAKAAPPTNTAKPRPRVWPSMIGLSAGAMLLVVGVVTALWSSESVPLDGALLGPVQDHLGVVPVLSVHHQEVDEARQRARAADEQGDPAARVWWAAVQRITPSDVPPTKPAREP
jgi:predicted Zn finger-like uncharacterized protein